MDQFIPSLTAAVQQALQTELPAGFARIVAVSYTHLDVYKRQLRGRAALHEVRLAEIPGIHNTDGCGNTGILIQHRRFDDRDTNILCQSGGNDAVSYTHLDVYKRQPA